MQTRTAGLEVLGDAGDVGRLHLAVKVLVDPVENLGALGVRPGVCVGGTAGVLVGTTAVGVPAPTAGAGVGV